MVSGNGINFYKIIKNLNLNHKTPTQKPRYNLVAFYFVCVWEVLSLKFLKYNKQNKKMFYHQFVKKKHKYYAEGMGKKVELGLKKK